MYIPTSQTPNWHLFWFMWCVPSFFLCCIHIADVFIILVGRYHEYPDLQRSLKPKDHRSYKFLCEDYKILPREQIDPSPVTAITVRTNLWLCVCILSDLHTMQSTWYFGFRLGWYCHRRRSQCCSLQLDQCHYWLIRSSCVSWSHSNRVTNRTPGIVYIVCIVCAQKSVRNRRGTDAT